jgi:hypothetical protein
MAKPYFLNKLVGHNTKHLWNSEPFLISKVLLHLAPRKSLVRLFFPPYPGQTLFCIPLENGRST